MAATKDVLMFVLCSALIPCAFSASLNGNTTSLNGTIDLDLESSSKLPLFFMNDNCAKTLKLTSRNALRVAPWSTHFPPPTVRCVVLVESARYATYRFVVTFKKVAMTSATITGPCVRSRLDMYTGNTFDTRKRISGTNGICGRRAAFEEYTTNGPLLNLVYTTNSLPRNSYEYFEAVITPYHHGTCKHDEFKCANSRCIKNDLLCNGYNNCGDDSDEKSCAALLLSVAAIAGIVVGCVVVVGIICCIVICKCCCGACGYERI